MRARYNLSRDARGAKRRSKPEHRPEAFVFFLVLLQFAELREQVGVAVAQFRERLFVGAGIDEVRAQRVDGLGQRRPEILQGRNGPLHTRAQHMDGAI